MTEKSTTRRTFSTTTRHWDSLDKLTPDQRSSIEKMMSGGKIDGASVIEKWSQADGDDEDKFVVEINGDAITVNGRKYENIDDVPASERKRVEAMREGFSAEGLADLFSEMEPGSGAAASTVSSSNTGFGSSAGSAADHSVPTPGAVPRTSAGRRVGQLLLIGICCGLIWLGVRWFSVG